MMRMKLLAMIGLGLCIAAGECPAGDLKVATLDYPPFQYEENGQIKGIAANIVQEIFRRLNRRIEIKFYPFPRAVENVKKGRADVIFTFYYKKEREEFADYSKEVLVDQTMSLFVHKDSPVVFDGDLSKLKPYSFGLVRFSYGSVMDNAISSGVISNTDYTAEMNSNIKKFAKRRFDILPSDRWVALYYYSKIVPKNERDLKELKPSIQTFPAYIGFSKVNRLTDLRDQVDSTLKAMKADGSYQKIIDQNISAWGIDMD